MKDTEIDWIRDLCKIVPQIDTSLETEKLKQTMLKGARDVIEKNVGEIKLGNDFKIEMLSDFFKFKYEMATVTGDPNSEFDVGHDLPKVGGVDPKQIKLLTDAQTVVFAETEKLRKARNPADNKGLFTDREIADAIWEPLKRRKLIPEAAIPDRYSEVSRGFEGASAAYGERLDAYNESLGKENKWTERLGVTKDVLAAAGSITTAVIGDMKLLGVEKAGNMPIAQVSDILKGVTVGVNSGVDIAAALVKSNGKIDSTVLESVCKSVVTIAQAEITAGLTTKDANAKAVGGAISTGVGLAVNVATLGRMLAKGEANISEVATQLGEMVESSLSVYAQNMAYEAAKKGEKEDAKGGVSLSTQIEMIGKAAKAAISTAGGMAAFVKNPSRATLQEALINMIKRGVEVTGDELAKLKKVNDGKNMSWGTFEKAADAITVSLAKIRAADEKGREKMVKEDPGIQSLVELVKKEEATALEGQSPEDWQDNLDADTRDFRDKLNRSETGDSEEDIQKVEELILQMKQDQAMVTLAFQLLSVGPTAVAAFLPAAGIAVSAISLVQNFYKAREHVVAYLEWKENASDARSAMSFQMEAMLNRQNNSRNQATDATIKALTDAAQIVCQAVACAGPFAPAGKAAGAAVTTVASVKDLILKYVAKAELEKAYAAFLTARANPGDRKQLREAVRKNATLAKYLIAWGALVDGNPVARRAMQKCGLSEEMLTSKNTNAQNAVSYLEAMYPEDPLVLQREAPPKAWYPGPVQFSAISFAAFANAAETSAVPKLKQHSCNKLLEVISRWEQCDTDQKKARAAWDKKVEAAEADGAAKTEVDEEAKAMLELQRQIDKAEAAAQEFVRLLPGEKMVSADSDSVEQAEVKEYLRLLAPTGVAFVKSYRRAAEALERQDGALQRDPNSGRLAA